MKQQIFAAALALCLCTSSLPAAHARQDAPSRQAGVLTEQSASVLIACDSTIPAPSEVYAAMIALKEQDAYKEGTPWTNDEPFSDTKGYYRWKGGPLNGTNIVAVGCVAFAFILSDEAFGNLPARIYETGKFEFADIKPGDILQVNNDAHTVIVLEVSDAGVVAAEGNYNKSVHWGRAISKEEVMRNTSHYITRYPEGYIPPDNPDADLSIADGTLEGGLNWNLTTAGTLTISGRGAMPADFSGPSDQPWNSFGSQIRKIVIEDGVTSIGSSAFYGNAALSVEIPGSVELIGNSAFYGCALISASIPSGVKAISDDAFCQCPNLTSVTVSEGVETIGQRAFQGCTKLASVSLPASIKEMGAGAFYNCTELSSVTFASGSNQVKMGEDLFAGCWRLSHVTLPQKIDCISSRMFQNCYAVLTNVSIPQGAAKIGDSAFSSCTSLTALTIPASVTDIETGAFSNCKSLSDIYFTGTEAQWNSIWKASNVTEALKEIAIHYEYSPGSDTGSGDDSGDNPGGDSGDNPGGDSGDNPGDDNGDNPGDDSSIATPEPTATAAPEPTATAAPEPTATAAPEPTATAAPEPTATAAPEPTATAAPEPTATAAPEPTATATPEPTATAAPEPVPTDTPPESPTPSPVPAESDSWITEEDGEMYWYEDGVKQGTEGRGKEIYDPETDAWYWLDAEQGGKAAKDKDVFMETEDGTGKWVRYDKDGKMIKGDDYRYGGWYHFDEVTGAMTKGWYTSGDNSLYYYDPIDGKRMSGECEIEGVPCYFEPASGKAADCVWHQTGEEQYWYENGIRQGLEGRGKEIYDPASGAWYWLDSGSHGQKAANKDVYQESYSAYPDRGDGTGKWVRYDENGHMVKGWHTTAAGTYYFEEITGAMAKGSVTINGRKYYFDIITGILQQ